MHIYFINVQGAKIWLNLQMNLQEAQRQLQSGLQGLYEAREAAALADWVMEDLTGWKKIDRLLHKNDVLATPALDLLKKYEAELLTHKPVQYVLKESWFAGMKFYVDEHVLIPRPETEELVDWIVSEAGNHQPPAGSHTPEQSLSILDVGTGSGCIPVALVKKLASEHKLASKHKSAATGHSGSVTGLRPSSSVLSVFACDISAEALAIARRNAATHDTPIQFLQLDFLDCTQWGALPSVHFLVSNPPYIPQKEKASMAPNVVSFEPHLALFVDDDDPLVFYRALAGCARQKLLPGGAIVVEIHEERTSGVMQLFRENGFTGLTLRKDMQGKERMIKATW
jgi:release factor glutamine methyltransferase